jgi:hypothetical protein
MIVIDGVEMVDISEAAVLARRTPETIRRWVWTGRLHAVKRGNKLFLARADLASEPSANEGDRLDLREWAELVSAQGRGVRGVSARDLVLEDRASRDGR